MFIDWIIKNSKNLFVIGAITFTCPEIFVKSIYSRNKGKKPDWMQKNSCLTISFDCDYPEDVDAIPSLLEMFEGRSFKTAFACIGYYIEKNTDIHKRIISEGHEIMNHTYSHPDNEILNPNKKFNELLDEEMIEEVGRCHQICVDLLNYHPIGLRIPHPKYLFTRKIYDFIHKMGYIYSSSTWLTGTNSSGLPFIETNDIIEIPLATCPKHPFSAFDTWHSLRTKRLSHRIKHRTSRQYLELFEKLINIGIETNSYINVYLDPRDIVIIEGFNLFLDLISQKYFDDIEVLTYREIVERIG